MRLAAAACHNTGAVAKGGALQRHGPSIRQAGHSHRLAAPDAPDQGSAGAFRRSPGRLSQPCRRRAGASPRPAPDRHRRPWSPPAAAPGSPAHARCRPRSAANPCQRRSCSRYGPACAPAGAWRSRRERPRRRRRCGCGRDRVPPGRAPLGNCAGGSIRPPAPLPHHRASRRVPPHAAPARHSGTAASLPHPPGRSSGPGAYASAAPRPPLQARRPSRRDSRRACPRSVPWHCRSRYPPAPPARPTGSGRCSPRSAAAPAGKPRAASGRPPPAQCSG